MPSAVRLREDYSVEELRALAPTVEDSQPEPAAVYRWLRCGRNGPRRGGEGRRHGPPDAARLGPSLQRLGPGGPDRQLDAGSRSLVCHRSNWPRSPQIVETGPDREKDGVVRWRRIDLKRVIVERFGVDLSRALCRKAAQDARLLPHQRKAAPSGAGREDRRGFQKNFPRALKRSS